MEIYQKEFQVIFFHQYNFIIIKLKYSKFIFNLLLFYLIIIIKIIKKKIIIIF